MRILVTGGAGFIGSQIADAALAAGHEVFVFDDLSTGKRANVPDAAEFFEADLRDGDAVRRIIAETRPDVVSHQAAQASVAISVREPVFDAEVNVCGSLHVMEACVASGVGRLIFASTGGAIYGEVPEPVLAGEDATPRPMSPYACAKSSVESYLACYANEHALASTVLRYANVYGPRQDPHGEAGVVAIFARRLLAGEPIQINARREPGDDGCVRDYVHVDDVVRTNLAAMEGKIEAPILNVCTGVATSTRALAARMKAVADSPSVLADGPRRPGDVERSVLDPARWAASLGAPVALEHGLAGTIDWFRRN